MMFSKDSHKKKHEQPKKNLCSMPLKLKEVPTKVRYIYYEMVEVFKNTVDP